MMSHTFTAELILQYIWSCTGSYKQSKRSNESYTPIYQEQTTKKCVDSLIPSTTSQFGVLALHHWYIVWKPILSPSTSFQHYARCSGLLCFCSAPNNLQFCYQIPVLHNCVECAVNTCTSKIHKTTMTVICAWVTVIYKSTLQVMLQYLICTAQVEKLHYPFTFLVGLATVQCI